MKRSRQIIILVIMIFVLLQSPTLAADDLKINAAGAILVDVNTGKVLYEQNADKKLYPASMTKMMTVILALEGVNNGSISLDDEVVISKKAANIEGSQAYFVAGEKVTVKDLITSAVVGSANDSALVLAEYIGVTEEGFANLMNAKAKSIGMKNTHFVNPHGLHNDNHYTTARDISILGQYAVNVPHMLDYTSLKSYDLKVNGKATTIYATNRLLGWYEGTDGLKTGTTTPAGRNLTATTKRNGLRLLSVVMGCSEKNSQFTQSMKLMNYGFNNYSYYQEIAKGEDVVIIDVKRGEAREITLVAHSDLDVTYKKSDEFVTEVIYDIPEIIEAPVLDKQVIGKASLKLNGKVVDEIDLVAKEGTDRISWLRSVGRLIKDLFTFTN